MKTKLLTLALLFIFCGVCWAEDIDMKAIAMIESSNNRWAFNVKTRARGLYQITPICLADYNKFHPKAKISGMALFCEDKAYLVANWYMNIRIPQLLEKYGIGNGIVNRLWCYNAGIRLCRNSIMPKETKQYIKKYLKLTRKGVK